MHQHRYVARWDLKYRESGGIRPNDHLNDREHRWLAHQEADGLWVGVGVLYVYVDFLYILPLEVAPRTY